MDWKGLIRKVVLFILQLAWKLFLTCVWACLRGIEFAARILGDWIKTLINSNDRRNDNYNRKTP